MPGILFTVHLFALYSYKIGNQCLALFYNTLFIIITIIF